MLPVYSDEQWTDSSDRSHAEASPAGGRCTSSGTIVDSGGRARYARYVSKGYFADWNDSLE